MFRMVSTHDPVTFWLNMAGKRPLLPKVETFRLATIIQSKDSSATQKERAISKLVEHNLRLIPKIVRKCMSSKKSLYYGGPGTDDLLQVGTIGLRRAAEKFNPELGYAFSTYAAPWIYQAVQRDLYNNLSAIRIPESCRRELYSYIDKHHEITFKHLDEPRRRRMVDAFQALHCASLDSDQRQKNRGFSDDSDSSESFLSALNAVNANGQSLSTYREDSFEDLLDLVELSETQKKLMFMVYCDGSTIVRASNDLGISNDKAKKLIKSALRSLRSVILR